MLSPEFDLNSLLGTALPSIIIMKTQDAQRRTQNRQRHYLFLLPFYFFLLTFLGCVSAPIREVSIPTYNIGDVTYLPLTSLCDLKGINLSYDTYARALILNRGLHKISLRIGDTMALVDGEAQYLRHPVDLYQGMVVVPLKFKEQVLDVLFPDIVSPYKKEIALVKIKIKKVVVDPGHGGTDPGAIAASGLREKDVNLDIAKRLSRILGLDAIDVVMTRSSDRYVSLSGRVDIANRVRPDLFLSIHANANRVKSLNGFEVYYVSSKVSDSSRALSSAKSLALNIDSSCFASRSLDLKATLWDMIYTFSRAESINLGERICRVVENNLDARVLGVKAANYYVLKGVSHPAVLIEVGFLSNTNEERKLRNGFYRQKIAEAIAEGLRKYAAELALAQTR